MIARNIFASLLAWSKHDGPQAELRPVHWRANNTLPAESIRVAFLKRGLVSSAGPAPAATFVLRWPAAVATTIVFLAITLFLALRLNLAQDESYSLHTAAHGFARGLHDGITFEEQAPLYFAMLAAWLTINGSIFFARLLSIGFSLTTLFFTWRFARRYLTHIAPDIVLAVVALNPFTIWAAVEMRPYAAAIALATALLYFLFRGWIDTDVAWRARAAFIVTAIIGAYTQYYVVTLVAAGGIALLVVGRRRFASYALASVFIAVCLVPMAFFLPLQLNSYAALAAASPVPAYAIVLALFEFLYPHHSIGSWAHRPLQNIVYFSAASVPVAILGRSLKRVAPVTRALLVITATLTVMFGIFISMLHVHVIFPRQTAVLFAPTLFSGFALVGDVARARRITILKTFAAIYGALVVLALWNDYHDLSKAGDWTDVGRFLTAHVAENDTVAVFDAEVALPLSYYFKALPVTAIPRPLSFDRFDERTFVIRAENDVAASLGRDATGHRHVWLVLNDVCDTLPAFYGCRHLDAYVSRHFDRVSATYFNASSVTELVAKSSP